MIQRATAWKLLLLVPVAAAIAAALTGHSSKETRAPLAASIDFHIGTPTGTPTATPTGTPTATASPPACTQTFTAAGFDNTPFNGDAVNTVVQGAGGTAPVLCFASGTYAGVDLYNGSPTVDVTLRPANGATVDMGGITVNHVSHIKIAGFTGTSTLDSVAISNSAGNSDHITVSGNEINGGGSAIVGNTNTNAAILFQGNRFDGQDGSSTDLNRLKLISNTGCPNGITIDANEMLNGTTDGVDIGDSCGTVISNNHIHDIGTFPTGGCTALNGGHPHCDAIQIVAGSTSTNIFGNLIETTDTGVSDYDGASSGTNVHDNVFWNVVGVGSGTINLGSTTNPVVERNTIGGSSGVNYINFGSKAGNQQTTGVVVRNNITPNGVAANGDQGATFTTNNYNMCNTGCTGANSLTGKIFGTHYTFTGGTPPFGSISGYALAAGSAGIGVASDGGNIGARP